MAIKRAGETGDRAASPLYDLPPLHEADFTTREPEARQGLEERMNLYFGKELEMFPYSEGDDRPGWFHAFYEGTIEERFPDDKDLRDKIKDYRRRFTKELWIYVGLKRLYAAAAMFLISLAVFVAPWMPVVQANPLISIVAALFWLGACVGFYILLSSLTLHYIYVQRVRVQSADLSRIIVQRTRDLKEIYQVLEGKIDMDETEYGDDGGLWGEESARLVRLLMWIAKRVEYIEKFIQTEMWRIRRQRFWADFGGAAMTVGLAIFAAGLVILIPTPIAIRGPTLVHVHLVSVGIKLIVALAFVAIAASSFFLWKTPNNLASVQLSPSSWVRFGNLDLDNTLGDQIRRDKVTIVRNRNVNRSFGGPSERH